MNGNFTLIRSTKPCPKCGDVEIFMNVSLCGKCLLEELKKDLPSDGDGKLILDFPHNSTKEAA